jgi:hypothetical protein
VSAVAIIAAVAAVAGAAMVLWIAFRLLKTIDLVIDNMAAERARHRGELEGLFNRIQHPRVFQPTPEQEKTIRHQTAVSQRSDDFNRAGRVFNFEPQADAPLPTAGDDAS